ncbi:gephyrin-like molybdotransferase Glp [Corynebacterium halotolerans]|uniref:Molybdopterin molybdenumtransferase n=1 Tax=Corynebacterium halotolerans YIM 70093 = DSM 44683 TaxID=1121362 RepID=M1MWU7_9CORY|nr:gephyrin-like molybdotransferase Glp [Corynebacterium halotolerans]AGF72224.1 molybdopterin biosynthesis protein MoeA [Corynebacterium halotolerans YIM 70093 = DSM 44683]
MSHVGAPARSIDEHLAAVLSLSRTTAPVTLPSVAALGSVLAADAVATLAVPPFSNSAMDGFLLHAADLNGAGPWTLPVAGDVPAGSTAVEVPRGAAVRIMTGAPVGDPVDPGLIVVPVEQTTTPPGPGVLPAEVTVREVTPGRAHIRRAGANTSPGDVVARAGTRVDAGTLAALVSAGVDSVSTHPPVRVAVISSGDELVEPGVTPGPGQIPDSNGLMLAALLTEAGVSDVSRAHAGDVDGGFAEELSRACTDNDLVITSGGVSAGAFDVVREVTGAGDMWFGHVAQKPGAPQGLGVWEDTPLVCLPGNPVAAFVSFHLYVAPLVRALAGHPAPASQLARPHVTAVAEREFPVPRDRAIIVPVRLDWSTGRAVATPFARRGVGSHLVASLVATDGLAVIAPDAPAPAAGDPVTVVLTH